MRRLVLFLLGAVALPALNAADPFLGTWNLNKEKSSFDQNHRVSIGTLRFEPHESGIQMIGEGTKEGGETVRDTAIFNLDGKERPVPELAGASAKAWRPDPNTIQTEARKDGRIIGEATYAVAADGKTLTATVSGIDARKRSFKQVTVWGRE